MKYSVKLKSSGFPAYKSVLIYVWEYNIVSCHLASSQGGGAWRGQSSSPAACFDFRAAARMNQWGRRWTRSPALCAQLPQFTGGTGKQKNHHQGHRGCIYLLRRSTFSSRTVDCKSLLLGSQESLTQSTVIGRPGHKSPAQRKCRGLGSPACDWWSCWELEPGPPRVAGRSGCRSRPAHLPATNQEDKTTSF